MDFLLIVGILVGLVGLVFMIKSSQVSKGEKVMNFPRGNVVFVSFLVMMVGAFLVIAQAGALSGAGIGPFAAVGDEVPTDEDQDTGQGATYQPTASYVTKDEFSNTIVEGTAWYKSEGKPATTSTKTNVNPGREYTYWVDNDSYYVKPESFEAESGSNDVVAKAWENGSVSIGGYDTVNHESIDDGDYNISMDSNGQANVEFTYQGTSKKSAGPFGGVMVLEFDNSMASVTCDSQYLLESNPYQVTYSPSSTDKVSKQFAYNQELDRGKDTSSKKISCQFQNGAEDISAGSEYKVTFIPANYYITDNGNIELDTEEAANQDTTRTGLQEPSETFYWA